MKIRENEIRIYYRVKEGILSEMDKELRKVAEKYGFHFWASGLDVENNIRDICFDRDKKM